MKEYKFNFDNLLKRVSLKIHKIFVTRIYIYVVVLIKSWRNNICISLYLF